MTLTSDDLTKLAALKQEQPLELDVAGFLGQPPEDFVAPKRGEEVKKLPPFGDVDGYFDLERVLTLAYDQSARGKGKRRHAKSRPFNDQPIRVIPALLGGVVGLGGLIYQVIKKAQESVGMVQRHDTEAAKAEILGAIVYCAAAYLHVEAMEKED